MPCVQVFDRDKTLKRSLYLAHPVSCCCYLNDEGDILLGIANRLVVVRASKYESIGGQGARSRVHRRQAGVCAAG